MNRQILAACGTLLLALSFSLAILLHAAGEENPTTLEELDKLPVGLKVVHDPNPALATDTSNSKRLAKYTWWFKTTVTPTGPEVKIVEFGAYVLFNGKWEFSNYTRKPFSSKDFADWYSCPDALIKQGKSYVDPTNWGGNQELAAVRSRWYYIGIDSNGKRVKGEAIIEQKGEIDPKRPKDKN